MTKTSIPYWNPLIIRNRQFWTPIAGMQGLAEELTLAIDEETGDYTRLTRFYPGADTSTFGSRWHEYPEEIFIIQGRLYDASFKRWLEVGEYASRPPREVHGPFKTDTGCIVLEMSFPSQTDEMTTSPLKRQEKG